MICRTVAVLALAVSFSAAPVASQQTDTLATSLQPGARSLSFGVLGGGSGGAFQYWRMRSERLNLGLMIALEADYSRSERDTPAGRDAYDGGEVAILAGPTLRRYATTTSRVNPFLYGHMLAGYHFRTSENAVTPETFSQHAVSGALAFGVGAEWFPVRSVSFSGQTGLQFGAHYALGESGPASGEDFGVFANTFTSLLSVNLYWPPRAR